MMKKFILFLLSVILLACSCSKLELAGITERINISLPYNFTSIYIAGDIDVIFTDDVATAQIEADVNLLPYVNVYEEGRQLKIEFEDGLNVKSGTLEATVIIPYKRGVNIVSAVGAATFMSDYPLVAKDVVITAAGASEVIGHILAEKSVTVKLSGASSLECGSVSAGILNLTLSGASEMKAAGKVTSGHIELSGASELEEISSAQKYSLEIGSCYGTLSGASEASFKSDGLISCNLSGASSISYIGNADISGSKCYDTSDIEKGD